MYTQEQFIKDVKAEAVALRENATREEIGSLNIELLEPQAVELCIYGQMTGDCRSPRAIELIKKCCKKYINSGFNSSHSKPTFTKILRHETPDDTKIYIDRAISHLSSIESYIMAAEAKNANLVAYLKGETDTLDL